LIDARLVLCSGHWSACKLAPLLDAVHAIGSSFYSLNGENVAIFSTLTSMDDGRKWTRLPSESGCRVPTTFRNHPSQSWDVTRPRTSPVEQSNRQLESGHRILGDGSSSLHRAGYVLFHPNPSAVGFMVAPVLLPFKPKRLYFWLLTAAALCCSGPNFM
jgi:hypothetical protein